MQARRGGRTLTLGGLVISTQVPLYELSRGETYEGAYAQGLDPMAIVTLPEQWAYAVTVPLNRSDLERHDRVCVKISVLVHAGCVGIGILHRDENSFVQEVSVGGSSSWREIALGIPNIETAGPLVIRNHSACGPSRVQLRIVDIECVADEIDQRPLGPLLAGLSADALIELAESLAMAPQLRPVPGWHFDGFETSADPGVHIRHGLWCAVKAQHCDRPVVVPWARTDQTRTSNDLSYTLFSGGCYEPNEFAVLDRVLKPGMVFLDGGANEGVYTVFASARVGPTGRVIAVEPSPRELERLKANIKINRAANVIIADVALAERPRSVKLVLAEQQHAGQNTLGAFIYEGVNSVDVRCVRAVAIDDLILTHGVSRLDIVKLDLEGAEFRALIGARNTLRDMRPLLLIEVSDAALVRQGGSRAALCKLLESAHYVPLTIDDTTGAPVPWTLSGSPMSLNMVAVHNRRDFGLLAKARRKPQTMTPN
jgi:FkbM family methyltransferase